MAQKEVKDVFLDANVLFTAAYNPEGLAAALISHQEALKIRVRTSRYAVEEAEHNLSLKLPASLAAFQKLLTFLEAVDVPIQDGFNPLGLPENDVPIFQAAVAVKSSHLLTGDKKAFGRWMNDPDRTGGLVIQTVRDFVDRL